MAMLLRLVQFACIVLFALMGATFSLAQTADNQGSVFAKPSEEDRPKSLKETLDKMRVDQEKKEYRAMLDKGDEALKLTEEIEWSVEKNGKLTERDMAKVASVEKLVKKIRGDLGGADDDVDGDDESASQKTKLSYKDAVKSLKASTASMIDELKKTSRFTISAAAIQGTNSVLRIIRIVRFTN